MDGTPSLRVDRATDDDRYLETDHLVWFDEVGGSLSTSEQLLGVPADQRFAVDLPEADPGSYAGIYGVRPLQLAVPAADDARLVPCAGLTWVGVHPDHRRKGVLTAMLRHHVEQTHREGVALSGLHASEPVIYGRHGWGVATQALTATLGRGAELRAPGLEAEAGRIRTQLVSASDAGMARRVRACELRVAASTPGMVVGEEGFTTERLRETPEELREKEPMRLLFARRDGVDVGFTTFRRSHKWEQGRPQGKLEVFALVGDEPARLALLRRLLDFDLMGTVQLPQVGLDDALWHWIGPRAASEVVPHDNLWLRIIDLPAALPLRSYAGDCDVVVELDDEAAPWQSGRWRVVAHGGEARAERTEAEVDVALPVSALGAAYLGGANLVALQRAGQLSERRAGAVAELWRAFRTEVAPAAASGF